MENKQLLKAIKIINDPEGHYGNNYSFDYIQKNGEMALITWIQVIQEGRVVVEVAERECILYF